MRWCVLPWRVSESLLATVAGVASWPLASVVRPDLPLWALPNHGCRPEALEVIGKPATSIVCPRCQHPEALLMGAIVRPTTKGPGKPIAHRYGCERCRMTFRVGVNGIDREVFEPQQTEATPDKRAATRRSPDMLWRD